MTRAHSSPRFRKWLELEQLKSAVIEGSQSDDFPARVFAYVSTALNVSIKKLEKQEWENTVRSLYEAYNKFTPKPLPILDSAPKDAKPVDWDYDSRTWNYYSHLMAKAYGWTLDYIGALDVNEALAHLQEILTDDQLEKEFLYGLSEIAYPYNKSTKKSEFKPMKRPYWMKPIAPKTIKKVVIRADMLPVGNIEHVSGLPPEYQFKEYDKAKKTKSNRNTPTV